MSPAFSAKATAPAARAARRRPLRTLMATTAQPGLPAQAGHQGETRCLVGDQHVHQGHRWAGGLGQGQGGRAVCGVSHDDQVGLQGDGLADGRPHPGVVVCHQQPDGPTGAV